VSDDAGLPVRHETVVHALADAARRRPDATALTCGDESLDYRGYAACVGALARELGGLGATGERVALLMANSLDIAIATFAAQAAGLQVVPLNPAYTAYELDPILENAAPVALIHDEACAASLLEVARARGVAHCIAVGPASRLTRWRDAPEGVDALPLPRAEWLSTLQYTGGTTGRSKGVDLTHHAVSINVSQREALLPTEPDAERILAVTPLFHVYAVSMGLYLSVYCRGELVILPRYRPDWVLQAIERHRITLFSGSPTIFIGLLGHETFARTDLRSLRLCFSGSAALPVETLRRWEDATGCVVTEGYGQSEAGPVLTYNPRHGVRKIGSVGVPLPGTEIQVVDVETGTTVLPAGSTGEIRARGPQIMRGYRGLPEETATALRDGWLYTGDIGVLDDDGYLSIRDRKKDMVIVGGFNVYPREVEEALHAHPAVAEAAVVGVPDSYRGEALVGFVVCRSGDTDPQALLEHLSARLVKYKIPRELRLVPTLPKTVVGKTDKAKLRTIAGAMQG
jgi:long-chain acyl-CoA synthetase